MESFTLCGNGNDYGNVVASKWVPTLFCATVAAAKYFALTLHYFPIAAAAHCEHFQWEHNEKHKKIAAAAAPCERTYIGGFKKVRTPLPRPKWIAVYLCLHQGVSEKWPWISLVPSMFRVPRSSIKSWNILHPIKDSMSMYFKLK